MSKLIAGFLLGVIVTLAVVYWLRGDAPELHAGLTSQSSQPEKSAAAPRADSMKRTGESAREDGADSKMSTPAEPDANGQALASQAQFSVPPQQDARSTSPSERSSARTTSDSYPPEIADMIENSVDKELQARYESDEREESWATYMEGMLSGYFARKPVLAQFYFSLIDCRTSICEVHALGYGPDALTQWNTATADIVSQQWFEFNNMSMNRRNPEPDILAIVLILTKKPPD